MLENDHFIGGHDGSRRTFTELDYSYLEHSNRFAREFWIGTAHGNLYEIHKSGVNHYDERYPREMYARD